VVIESLPKRIRKFSIKLSQQLQTQREYYWRTSNRPLSVNNHPSG
jgi:hypothetical protein